MNLNLNVEFLGFKVPTDEGKYNVLYTDYDSYALVWTCTTSNWFIFTYKMESAWILSRTKVLDATKLTEAREKLFKAGIDLSKMTVTDQSCP